MDLLSEDIHPHCLLCVKLAKCTVRPTPGESCNIINCHLECGAKFHACKSSEHKLLCINQKVPCINAEYGCPAMLFRKHQSRHLISCPASIIHCSEEWDRWPIHLHDKKDTRSHLDPSLRGELDVALALRDQIMLQKWGVAASQGQPLSNQRFTTSSSLWVFRKWHNSRESSYPPGLEESMCKELGKARKETSNPAKSSTLIISNDSIMISNNQDPESQESSETSDKENSGDFNNKKMDRIDISKPKSDSIYSTLDKPSQELSANNELPHFNLDDILQLSQFGTIVFPVSAGEGSIYVPMDENLACQILDLKFRNPASTPPWCLSLGLDLNLESRAQQHPSNFMYTFSCCQEFRRDEYHWHYKNVHSDIHGGLNGWLLERCPLAQYGCKFVRKRFNPVPSNSKIVYNDILESFGLTYSLPPKEEKTLSELDLNSSIPRRNSQNLNLTDLPFDVLQHIVRFLDSFSLANLSLASSLLRDVCSMVLKEQGLVQFKWEKHKLKDNKCTWKRSKERRWCFSSHFSPIHTWDMDDQNNMANHLKVCPFFTRVLHKKAWAYGDPLAYGPHPPPHDKRFKEPLKELYENNMTKL